MRKKVIVLILLLVYQVNSLFSQQQMLVFSASKEIPKKFKNVCKSKVYRSPLELKNAVREVWLQGVEWGYYLCSFFLKKL